LKMILQPSRCWEVFKNVIFIILPGQGQDNKFDICNTNYIFKPKAGTLVNKMARQSIIVLPVLYLLLFFLLLFFISPVLGLHVHHHHKAEIHNSSATDCHGKAANHSRDTHCDDKEIPSDHFFEKLVWKIQKTDFSSFIQTCIVSLNIPDDIMPDKETVNSCRLTEQIPVSRIITYCSLLIHSPPFSA